MDTRLSFSQALLQITFLASLILSNVRRTDSQVTAVPVCENTGHRCITIDRCASVPDGQYQWCGGCQNHVRCLGGFGQLYAFNFQPNTQWDDNKKNYEPTSTTCTECYYPCPPGPSAPTNPSGPRCNLTGFGCLTTTCPGGAASGNFQYCYDCDNYVTCSISSGYSLVACAAGTYYDDFSRTCVTSSTTCRECYATCFPPTTVAPTTEGPSTADPTTEGPTEEPTNQNPGSSDSTTVPDGGPDGEDGTTTDSSNGSSTTLGATSGKINTACFCILTVIGVVRALLYKM